MNEKPTFQVIRDLLDIAEANGVGYAVERSQRQALEAHVAELRKEIADLRALILFEATTIIENRAWQIREEKDWTRLPYSKDSYLAGLQDALTCLKEDLAKAEAKAAD